MKRIAKWIALALAALLLLGSIGCKGREQANTAGDDAPVTIDTKTAAPTAAEAAPVPETTPVPTPDPAASEAFSALDKEIFTWYATSDGFSFLFLIDDPQAIGIDPATVEMSWGDFSEESSHENALEADAFLTRLREIPRSGLSEAEQLAYDVIEQYLTDVVEGDKYPYFYEPLTKIVGLQANMPLNMALLPIDTEQDAVDYITLLNDTPRYYGQLLTYEQGRAEAGLFMTEDELDGVLLDCKGIMDSRDASFLYTVLNDAVDAIDGLSDERRAELKKSNADALEKNFFPAYDTLYDGLKGLRGKCRTKAGMCAISADAKAYYAYGMRTEADNLLSVEETYQLLDDELMNLLVEMIEIGQSDPNLFDRATDLTSGDTETDVALLKSITAEILPALPEHEVDMQNVPEELEDMLSPAAYVIPPVDEWKRNTVLINLSSVDDEFLLTLAHEMYPGHLYQYVYQRALESPSYMQRAAGISGYSEGWSQLSEDLVLEHQTTYDHNYGLYTGVTTRFNTLLPAVASILVNYYGYNEESLATSLSKYLQFFDVDTKEIASSFYATSVEMPFYYMKYAVGYAQLKALIRYAQDELGDAYDESAFLKAYLDMGRGQFNLIEERMYVWIDGQIVDSAG